MLVQYLYALGTMLPCPLWFWYRWSSASFLTAVFVWSIYNGATYYIDVFGKRFQNELEQLKKEVAKWQTSPEHAMSPLMTPKLDAGVQLPAQIIGEPAIELEDTIIEEKGQRMESTDRIPRLASKQTGPPSSALDQSSPSAVLQQKLPDSDGVL